MSLRVVPVTPDRWNDMCTLFEHRGPRGGMRNVPAYGCWCMYWRDRSLEHGEPKKRAMRKLVRAGREPGLLAYDGDDPVGWVSVGPREEFPPLLRSPQYRPREPGGGDSVWSLAASRSTGRRSGKASRGLCSPSRSTMPSPTARARWRPTRTGRSARTTWAMSSSSKQPASSPCGRRASAS